VSRAPTFGIPVPQVFMDGRPDMALVRSSLRRAEELGFESAWVQDQVAGQVPLMESVSLLCYAAAVTERMRLATGILILPQRHPIYTAKEVATLDQLSDGRVTLGIGIGWLQEEFLSLGIPFEERVGRSEECVAALRQLWSEETKPFKGTYYQWDAIESNPKPVQPGGVPIVVGGHVDAAARRAARIGNGFFPGKGDLDRIQELLGIMSEECAKVGRSPDEVDITAGVPVQSKDDVKRCEDVGISRLVLMPPAFDPDGLEKGLESYGNTLIA